MSVTLICSQCFVDSLGCSLCIVGLAPTPGDSISEWCPQCPVLYSPAQLLKTHACGFFYGVSPSHILVFCCLLLLPALLLFLEISAFSKCALSRRASVLPFWPPVKFRPNLPWDPLVCPSGGPGESSLSTPYFRWINDFLLSAFFTVLRMRNPNF